MKKWWVRIHILFLLALNIRVNVLFLCSCFMLLRVKTVLWNCFTLLQVENEETRLWRLITGRLDTQEARAAKGKAIFYDCHPCPTLFFLFEDLFFEGQILCRIFVQCVVICKILLPPIIKSSTQHHDYHNCCFHHHRSYKMIVECVAICRTLSPRQLCLNIIKVS